jgi:hypothetical protein
MVARRLLLVVTRIRSLGSRFGYPGGFGATPMPVRAVKASQSASARRKPARPNRSNRASDGRTGAAFIRCMVLKATASV